MPLVPGSVVESLAMMLGIDLKSQWEIEQCGPLTERFWSLHSKAELQKLCGDATLTKAEAVRDVIERQVPFPKVLAKAKV